MDGTDAPEGGKCPVMHGAATNAASRGRSNTDWWPNQLNHNLTIANLEKKSRH